MLQGGVSGGVVFQLVADDVLLITLDHSNYGRGLVLGYGLCDYRLTANDLFYSVVDASLEK